jgi:hypothetical protein
MKKWIIHEAVKQTPEWDNFKNSLYKYNHTWEEYRFWEPMPDGDIVRCPVWDAIRYNSHCGMFCNLKELDVSSFYNKIEKLLERKWFSVTMGDLKKQPEYWMEKLGANKFFIKASAFGKIAGSHVIGIDDIDFYKKKYKVQDEQLMIIAYPINLIKEYRIIVKDNLGFTACQYKTNEKMDIAKIDNRLEEDILNWANNDVIPMIESESRLFVLDVGITKDNKRTVIEMNSFSSSGFYKCDLDKIVKKVTNV